MQFKTLLIEYLTDKQRKQYAKYSMSDKARSDTDHFFGVGNDKVTGHIDESEGHQHEKSEIHKAVERHIGKEISVADYRDGKGVDHLGRQTRLGRLIKDAKLRDQFASDNTREGSKIKSVFTTSTHRGVEVAGQTNSEPTELHPKGHSWGDMSCKNVKNGSNKHYLPSEIEHGTVIHFVHDHSGKEIYRAALQPHHNNLGEVRYAVNSEYGVKHPAFTNSAQKVADALSHSNPQGSGIYHVHPSVYNDVKTKTVVHVPVGHNPNVVKDVLGSDPVHAGETLHHYGDHVSEAHLNEIAKSGDSLVKSAAIVHPKATARTALAALSTPFNVSEYTSNESQFGSLLHAASTNKQLEPAAIGHLMMHAPSASKSQAMATQIWSHPNLPHEFHEEGVNHHQTQVRTAIANNPNIAVHHIERLGNDRDTYVQSLAMSHPKAPMHVVEQGLNHSNPAVRRRVALNSPHTTADHVTKLLQDKEVNKQGGVLEKLSTQEHVDIAVKTPGLRDNLTTHVINKPNLFAPHHIDQLMNSNGAYAKVAALHHPEHVSAQHVEQALADKAASVRSHAVLLPHVSQERRMEVIKTDPHKDVALHAIISQHATREHYEAALNHPDKGVRQAAQRKLENL
jgi:hypothetical protein